MSLKTTKIRNPLEAAKVGTLVKFFNVGKTYVCYPYQDFEMQFFSNLLNTNGYLRVSCVALTINHRPSHNKTA